MSESATRISDEAVEFWAARQLEQFSGGVSRWSAIGDGKRRDELLRYAREDLTAIVPLLCGGLEEELQQAQSDLEADHDEYANRLSERLREECGLRRKAEQGLEQFQAEENAALGAATERAEHLTQQLSQVREEVERLRNQHADEFCDAILAILDSSSSLSGDGGSSGVELIAAERRRQVAAEDYDPVHDDCHSSGEILDAAIAYIIAVDLGVFAGTKGGDPHEWWPFTDGFKPSGEDDPIRDLTKAGALIAAEIDRLQRANGTSLTQPAVSEVPGDGSGTKILPLIREVPGNSGTLTQSSKSAAEEKVAFDPEHHPRNVYIECVDGYLRIMPPGDWIDFEGLVHYVPAQAEDPVAAWQRLKDSVLTVLDEESFWDQVDKSGGDNACWPWTGKHKSTGYGQVYVPVIGRLFSSHRLAYELVRGPIPKGRVLDHLCHNDAECKGGEDCPPPRLLQPRASRGGHRRR
jgi:hypothetical protein